MIGAVVTLLARIFGAAGTLMVPLSVLVVSTVYYRTSPPTQRRSLRFLASAHGVSIALLWGLMLFWAGQSEHSASRVTAFECMLVLPLALMIASLWTFEGPRKVHLLQIVNLGALVYIGLVGMVVLAKWNSL